jgi:hypothetical protein
MIELPQVSDDDMKRALAETRAYTLVILKRGPAYDPPSSDATIWEHGRRNFALRAAGLLSIVCPVNDGGRMAGVCVFASDATRTDAIMAADPAVCAGVLSYEVHPTRSFAGDSLPLP